MSEQLQQKYYEFQVYEEHLKKLKEQFEQIDEQLLEIEYIKNSIDELGDIGNEKDMLCPVTNGIFVKAKVRQPEHFLVNVGDNVVCKKSPEQTKKLLEKQKEELEGSREKVGEKLESLQQRMQELEKELHKLIKD
ncbi:MAG: prefoldin subunit alpha [Candidatus Nanoarchaeia archaeon]